MAESGTKIASKKSQSRFHKAYRTRNQEDWDLYKEARRAFKTALRRSKRESWRYFCTKTEKVHESARLYKVLEKTSENEVGMLRLTHVKKSKVLYFIYLPRSPPWTDLH